MDDQQRCRTESFERVLTHMDENPLATPIAAVTALVTGLTTTTAALNAKAGSQYLGLGNSAGGSADKRQLKKELSEFLAELAETAKVLDGEAHPGLAEAMRIGNGGKSYLGLLAQARGFHTALVEAKDDFVAYGSAPTVDADLMGRIEALEAATERKNSAKAMHIDGTASLAALCKSGVQIVQKLDAILSKVYKNDAGKLAAWKAARRCPKVPSRTAPPPPPPTEGSGSGTSGTGS